MNSILFLIAAMGGATACLTPKVENFTSTWTNRDTATYTRALDRCKVHFGDSAPCLTKFIKKSEDTYYAICGHIAPKLPTRTARRGYWFTISVSEGQEPKDYVFGSTANEVPGCGKTCPTKRPNSAGGK